MHNIYGYIAHTWAMPTVHIMIIQTSKLESVHVDPEHAVRITAPIQHPSSQAPCSTVSKYASAPSHSLSSAGRCTHPHPRTTPTSGHSAITGPRIIYRRSATAIITKKLMTTHLRVHSTSHTPPHLFPTQLHTLLWVSNNPRSNNFTQTFIRDCDDRCFEYGR